MFLIAQPNRFAQRARTAIAQAVAIGLLEKTERCLASQHFELREALMVPQGADVGVYVRDAKLRESSESYYRQSNFCALF